MTTTDPKLIEPVAMKACPVTAYQTAKHLVAVQGMKWEDLDGGDRGYWTNLAIEALEFSQNLAPAAAAINEAAQKERAGNYKSFTDGMEAAAQICGSLAETTYDDADAFEAATGCEAAIMRVVMAQRREQAAIEAHKESQHGDA